MARSLVAFRPESVSSTLAVTSTSQRIALSAGTSNVYISNIGTKECFVAFGDATVTATAGGAVTAAADGAMAIPAGFYGVISCGRQSNIAAICAGTDTTTLRVTPGEGE
jgi:hypothetical protein